ncbi:PaaI family thioesterase [Corynebacterium ulceribovis]|uniref:PaaI family thioesterase n=1 Tax=Corynebacterium ulceribovis TaxID=487732 RepID=UPI000366DE40|nr:PaaI family thioesterase [Corynebacterium ulceribovis]
MSAEIFTELIRTATQRELTTAEIEQLNNGMAGPGAPENFDKLIGDRYLAAGPEGITVELTVGPEHCQPWGITHGGVYAALGETAGSIAAFIAAGADLSTPVVGTANNTDFIRSSKVGTTIHSTATLVHKGRTHHLWLINHVDADTGKPLARTNLRLAVLG